MSKLLIKRSCFQFKLEFELRKLLLLTNKVDKFKTLIIKSNKDNINLITIKFIFKAQSIQTKKIYLQMKFQTHTYSHTGKQNFTHLHCCTLHGAHFQTFCLLLSACGADKM
jgi:hypothetical protein